MRLFKRTNGFWYIEYGRGKFRSLQTKLKDEAVRLYNIEKQLIRKGKVAEIDRASRIRLAEFLKEYLSGREFDCTPDTLKNDALAFRKLMDFSGDVGLRAITRKTVGEFRNFYYRQGLSKTYINILLRSLRAGFNRALGEGYIADNPFLKKKGQPPVEFSMDEEPPRYLRLDEIERLKAAASPEFRAVIEFALLTGCRRSEILRLQWNDIDFDNGLIFVLKTKSKKGRSIPMHEALIEVISGIGKKNLGPVFWRWRSPDTISRLFAEVCGKAGIKARFHDLRHTFGSFLAMNNVDIKSIKELMGHSDIKTTEIYAKVSKDYLKTQINRLSFGGK